HLPFLSQSLTPNCLAVANLMGLAVYLHELDRPRTLSPQLGRVRVGLGLLELRGSCSTPSTLSPPMCRGICRAARAPVVHSAWTRLLDPLHRPRHGLGHWPDLANAAPT